MDRWEAVALHLGIKSHISTGGGGGGGGVVADSGERGKDERFKGGGKKRQKLR